MEGGGEARLLPNASYLEHIWCLTCFLEFSPAADSQASCGVWWMDEWLEELCRCGRDVLPVVDRARVEVCQGVEVVVVWCLAGCMGQVWRIERWIRQDWRCGGVDAGMERWVECGGVEGSWICKDGRREGVS
ncbi:hypothetical protein E2C01_090009 [Portunus trituberculatus]|uniref:Uncharacterized protein n=1 Tax=Portunus trituberculatus TaxID=210409 RepID=A0A5B7JKA8_PORTR|nr:hypothetical protein [Portunus trituberculatus]